MGQHPRKTIALIGMMGAGKSAIGKALAERLKLQFVDSDDEIQKAAQLSITEIFARDGEAFFRKREREIIGRLLQNSRRVMATGGGAILSEQTRGLLKAEAFPLWLDADLDLLWSRVRHKNTRPLLQTADPYGTLSRLYTERKPLYEAIGIRVECEAGLSISETTSLAEAALLEHGAFIK